MLPLSQIYKNIGIMEANEFFFTKNNKSSSRCEISLEPPWGSKAFLNPKGVPNFSKTKYKKISGFLH